MVPLLSVLTSQLDQANACFAPMVVWVFQNGDSYRSTLIIIIDIIIIIIIIDIIIIIIRESTVDFYYWHKNQLKNEEERREVNGLPLRSALSITGQNCVCVL